MIFIVGPTATGKTALALTLAQKLNADILSSDSRQIYQGLEITSGADLPADFSEAEDNIGAFKYFTNGTINFYGVSFLKPDQEWSIAHFRDLAELVSTKTEKLGKKMIVVGGSGLYHQALFLNKQILNIKPSEELREQLQNSSLEELQQKLKAQYPNVETILNESDWKNPRRLIRWIEKTASNPNISLEAISVFGFPEDHHWIGLNCQTEILEQRIQERVEERLKNGSINEVELFLSHVENKKLPSTSTLGVKDIALFINDQISKEELIKLWSKHEFQYAKRQMTWFNKRNYIKWVEFDEVLPSQLIGDILE